MILTDNIQCSDHRLLYGWQDMTLQEVYEAIQYVIERKYSSINIKRFKFWRLQKRLAYRNLMSHITDCLDSFNNNSSSGTRKIKFPGVELQEPLDSEYRNLKFKQRDIMILEIIGDKSAFQFTENDDEVDEEASSLVISSSSKQTKVEKKRMEKKIIQKAKAEKQSGYVSEEEQSDRDDQEYKASRSIRNKKPSPLGCGLNNLGNSCYMNASIQCLYNTTPFANYMIEKVKNDPSSDDLIMRLTSRSRQRIDNFGDEFKQLRLLPKFHEVLLELRNQKKPAISPLLFKRTAGLFDPQFSGNKQCDAQEFICFLLNQLNEELSNDERQESKRDSRGFKRDLPNAVTANFHGTLLSRIECSECNHFSSRKDPFLSLSLPVLEKRSFISLQLFKLGCAIPRTIEIQYNFTQDNIGDLDMFLKMHFEIEGGLIYFEFNDGYLLQQLTNSKSLRVVHHQSQILAFIIPDEMSYHFAVNQEENNLLAGIQIETDHSAFFLEFKHKGKLQNYPTLCMSNHLEHEDEKFETEQTLIQEIGRDVLSSCFEQPVNCIYKSSRNVQKACIGNPIKIHRIDIDQKVDLFRKIREEVEVEQLRISACELHRAVSVVESDDSSLNDCFINFCRMEQLDQENLWTCQKCQKSSRAIKSIELDQVPPFLILHLKRFTSTRRKIERPIRFPLNDMNLQLSDGDVVTFDLYGIINHYGSLDRGHYTAMCKVGADEDGKWALFNDNAVQQIETNQINKKSAYVLFYKRR